MINTSIIIPSRLDSIRLPNKPLKLINNKEMILHVYDAAIQANVGDVIVATPDEQIIKIVHDYGGKAVLTNKKHQTGTDRIFEAFENNLKKVSDVIINLQGDMPNIKPVDIKLISGFMNTKKVEISTLASNFENSKEIENINNVKVVTEKKIGLNNFSKAKDFYRSGIYDNNQNIYHHIGIYAFTREALIRYVSLKRSKLERDRNLEQLRALENKMQIDVGLTNNLPISVDTEIDLKKIKKVME